MINTDNIQIQQLDINGVKTLVEWARTEGWNPGPFDAEIYWATDPKGFYGFYIKDTLIAGGAIVSYNNEFGFMGLFIVKPEFRSNGLGRKLWYLRRKLLIDRLNKGASIGMDGVVSMQAFYKKGGFEIAFKDERYEKIGETFELDQNISEIKPEDHAEILKYDKICFGYSRPKFLIPWINIPENRAFKYTVKNNIEGYAVVRKVSTGFKIGPLFANNFTIAEELYKACLSSVVGKSLFIDIPMINNEAFQLVKKYKAKYVFECARMYYGKPPQINMNKVFGITTFELG